MNVKTWNTIIRACRLVNEYDQKDDYIIFQRGFVEGAEWGLSKKKAKKKPTASRGGKRRRA